MKTFEEIIEAEAEKREKEVLDAHPDGFHVAHYCNGWMISDSFEKGAQFSFKHLSENPMMIESVREMKKDLDKFYDFIDWLEAGFGGMFGRPDVTAPEDAYDMIPEKMEELKLALKNLTKGESDE